MSVDIKNKLRKVRNRAYLAKDFDSFRAELLEYAKIYFPDKIQDFSEASVGGMLLDMAAFVGDSMSFYLDHQFHELNWSTAKEIKNIEQHIKTAGVKVTGSAPAAVYVVFYIEVEAETDVVTGESQPSNASLPIIYEGSTVHGPGVQFTLTEDLNFSSVDANGDLIATVQISETDPSSGAPTKYIMTRTGLCVSGKYAEQSFNISSNHIPFRKVTIKDSNVTEIISVKDAAGNTYYEVEFLTHDVVYKGILNIDEDNQLVRENIELLPAPYRYVADTSITTRLTTLTFGAGDANTLDDDIIPDPADLALPLYGKKNFSRFSIDPNALLKTRTLGIAPKGTKLTVKYRHGGGLSHNVSANSIRTPGIIDMRFPNSPTTDQANIVRRSLDVINPNAASGGANSQTLEDYRLAIPAARSQQSRVVTKEDLLARIYTLPARFGRVWRAGVRANPDNPLSSMLYIICMDNSRNLTTAPDALKKNLRLYLNDLRLISDAIDILDSPIINYSIEFSITVDPTMNRPTVVAAAIRNLQQITKNQLMQIDQPILTSDLESAILQTDGVLSLVDLVIQNKTGTEEDRTYSETVFDVESNTTHGMVVGTPGSIFELKYPNYDIFGSAI